MQAPDKHINDRCVCSRFNSSVCSVRATGSLFPCVPGTWTRRVYLTSQVRMPWSVLLCGHKAFPPALSSAQLLPSPLPSLQCYLLLPRPLCHRVCSSVFHGSVVPNHTFFIRWRSQKSTAARNEQNARHIFLRILVSRVHRTARNRVRIAISLPVEQAKLWPQTSRRRSTTPRQTWSVGMIGFMYEFFTVFPPGFQSQSVWVHA